MREKERCPQTARGDESRSGFSSSGLGYLEADGTVCIETRRQGGMDQRNQSQGQCMCCGRV